MSSRVIRKIDLDEIQSNPLRYGVTYHYKDQFMKPLLIAVITQSNCSYTKYLVYLTFALDRQKVLPIIVLIITRCVSQCYSLYLLFSLTDIFVVNFSNHYNYVYSQRICNLCK